MLCLRCENKREDPQLPICRPCFFGMPAEEFDWLMGIAKQNGCFWVDE